MGTSELTLSFSEAAIASFDALILEQGKVGDSQVTRLDLVKELATSLYGGAGTSIDCGIVNGKFGVEIFVYPYTVDLSYNIQLSHGKLAAISVDTVTVTETLTFSLSDTAETKYPLYTLLSLAIGDACWDEDGNTITTPNITWEGTKVRLSKKIYGAATIVYQTLRHSYRSYIPARPGVPENPYQSVCLANWAGGVKLLKLQVPETVLSSDNACAWELHDKWLINIPPDKISKPTADGIGRSVTIDYCTQKVENDTIY